MTLPLRSEGCTSFPLANPEPDVVIFSTGGAERTLEAAGAYARTDVVSVKDARTLAISIAYDAAGAGGYPVLIPLASNAEEEPAVGDDAWFTVPVSDGLVTTTTLAGALASGADFTQAPGLGLVDVRGTAIKPMAGASGASDEVRVLVLLHVAPYRWIHFQIAEVGATGTPGAAKISASVGT